MALPYQRPRPALPAPEPGVLNPIRSRRHVGSSAGQTTPAAASGDPGISNRLRMKMRDAFMKIDTDNSGSIDKPEFKEALRNLKVNISNEEVDSMFHRADTNRDGTIDFDEYMSLATGKLQEKHKEDEVQQLFDLLCDKRTRKVTMSSLRGLAHKLNVGLKEEEIDQMFLEEDFNGDRAIDRAEFDEIVRQCGLNPHAAR